MEPVIRIGFDAESLAAIKGLTEALSGVLIAEKLTGDQAKGILDKALKQAKSQPLS